MKADTPVSAYRTQSRAHTAVFNSCLHFFRALKQQRISGGCKIAAGSCRSGGGVCCGALPSCGEEKSLINVVRSYLHERDVCMRFSLCLAKKEERKQIKGAESVGV
jgi:hypothetical protein